MGVEGWKRPCNRPEGCNVPEEEEEEDEAEEEEEEEGLQDALHGWE